MHQVGRCLPPGSDNTAQQGIQAGEQEFLYLLGTEHHVCPTAADLDGMHPLHYAFAPGYVEAADALRKVGLNSTLGIISKLL